MPTPAMKEETKRLIAKFWAEGVSQRAIAARLGVSNGAVDKFKDYKGQEPKAETSLDDRSSVAHLQAKSRTLERTLKGLLEERGKHKALVEDLRGAVAAIVPYPRVPFKSKSTSSKPVAAVLKLSDWQIGEVIDSTETEGFGSFDFATAEDRVLNQLIPGFLSWVDMHRKAGYNLRRLDIFSEADLVSGNIHYELEVTNEFPVTIAAAKAGFLLAECASRLAAHFDEVVLWEMSADNHGRMTRKNQAKQGAKNNWSFISHTICNEALKKHNHVRVEMGDGTKLLANVLGKRFLISHGHHIMGQMGIPYYGMERDRAREAVKRQHTDKTFDYVSIGHWHVPAIIGSNILVNGSLTGTTEFDHMCGRHARPSQVSFMVHPEHGLFDWTAWNLA